MQDAREFRADHDAAQCRRPRLNAPSCSNAVLILREVG